MVRRWRDNMARPQNLVAPTPLPTHLSPNFVDWIHGSPHSMWMETLHPDGVGAPTGTTVGTSDYFRNGLRPIFQWMYTNVYLNNLIPINLGAHVRRANDGTLRVDGPATMPVTATNMVECIGSFRTMIVEDVFCSHQVGPDLPAIAEAFDDLCGAAVGLTDLGDLRSLLYVILHNPVIFDDEDAMNYMTKGYHISLMDFNYFVANIRMTKIDNYLQKLSPGTRLYEVMVHKCNADVVPTKYWFGNTCFHFYLNAKTFRHGSDKMLSLHDIHDLFMALLGDVVPWAFYYMARHHIQFKPFYSRANYEAVLEEPPNRAL